MFGVTPLVKTLEAYMQRGEKKDVMTLKSIGLSALLLVNFQKFRGLEKFIDVKIAYNGLPCYSCHKLVLSCFSSYFEKLLQG